MSVESVLLIALSAVSCLNFLLILSAVDAVGHAVGLFGLAIIRATSRIEGELADIRETIERIDADLRSAGDEDDDDCSADSSDDIFLTYIDDDDDDEEPEDKFWERN